MFAQSDPAAIAEMLTAAGFETIDIAPVTVNMHLGPSTAAAAAHLAETGPGRAVLETIPDHRRPEAIAAVEAALAEHLTPGGVQLGGATWITTARRPT